MNFMTIMNNDNNINSNKVITKMMLIMIIRIRTIKDTSVVQFMTLMNDNNRNKVLLINIMLLTIRKIMLITNVMIRKNKQ